MENQGDLYEILQVHPAAHQDEFERNLIRDRTNAGLAAARARGRTGGRPKKLDEQQRQLVARLYKEGTPIPEILKTVKISKGTLYSYVREKSSRDSV